MCTSKADKLAQVAGHEMAQLGNAGNIHKADKELPLQAICCEHQPLCVCSHKLLHSLQHT